jgi:hypothetical protein
MPETCPHGNVSAVTCNECNGRPRYEATDEWIARYEATFEPDPPDGWMIRHGRAFGPPCHFGPFATLREAVEWAEAHPHVAPGYVPLYLTVDWER